VQPTLKSFIKIISFINSGNTVLVFIDKDSLIKKYNVIIKRLLVLKLLYFANGLLSSFITHYFITKLIISHYTESMLFYIIKLLPLTLVILKMP
jgi:D-Tyr-tRNAtyr deacylase